MAELINIADQLESWVIAMTNREEVAERLRVYATDFDFGDSNPIWYVEKAVFNDIRIREQGRVFSSLADLIDPTCKLHITSEILTESITKYTAECSNCGAIFGDFPTMEQAKTTHFYNLIERL